jgi:DNA-binding NarL/FixJ family response regulator
MSRIQNLLIQKGLSNRQAHVADLLSQGLSNAEIANTLFITSAAVKFHLRSCYKALYVKNRCQLLVLCLGLKQNEGGV